MSNAGEARPAVQSVDRALTILEILEREGWMGVTTLARELGIHKSTAFRLLATLEQRGIVEQHVETQKYRLGFALVRLASAVRAGLDLTRSARPVCEWLSEQTGEKTEQPTPRRLEDAVKRGQIPRSAEVQTVFGKSGLATTATDPAGLDMFETTITLKPESEWRAGMTWGEKECVAARRDGLGALVLSEFTGAAAELDDAFLVNPHDVEDHGGELRHRRVDQRAGR